MLARLDDIRDALNLLRLDILILGCHLRIAFLKYRQARIDSAAIMADLRLTTLYLEQIHRS
jgi:hypothetical protein